MKADRIVDMTHSVLDEPSDDVFIYRWHEELTDEERSAIGRPGFERRDRIMGHSSRSLPQGRPPVDAWPDPRPLVPDAAEAAPYPMEVVREACPMIGRAIRDVATAAQAHEALAAAAIITSAATVAQGRHDVTIDGRCYPLSVYALTVAHSGERKSECDRLATAAIVEHERARQAEYRAAMARWKADKEGTVERPTNPRMRDNDPTLEGLARSFADGCPSRLIASSDAGLFVGGYGMSKDHRLKTAAGLTMLWDGQPITRTRAQTNESVTYYGRRLSMHLAGQPAALDDFVTDPTLKGQGLLARCLLADVPLPTVPRTWSTVERTELHGLVRFHAWAASELEKPLPLRPGTLELDPVTLRFDARGRELYVEAFNRNQAGLVRGGALDPIREFGSRIPEHVARLAGIFAVCNRAEVVGEREVEGAVRLVEWYADQWHRVARGVEVHRELAEAGELLDWLRTHRPSGTSRRAIYRDGPRWIRSRSRTDAALGVLVAHGFVRVAADGDVTLNPKVAP